MSSSSGPLTKDLQCSICLEVFTDPVSTPCGHNFCKSCLNKCWSNSQTCSCPYCKETFTQRPDLKTNTTLREISERYGQNPSRLQMTLMIQDTQKMIQDRIKTIQDLKHSARVRIRNLKKSKASHVKLRTDLIRSIERWHTEQLEMMEEQQKAAEEQEEELIEELEQEITELKMRNTELEQLSHTEDHLHLLQIYSFLQCRPADTRNWNEISLKTCDSLEALRKSLDLLKNTVEEKLSQTVLKWMQQYAVDVTLDPDTAQPELILSADGKQVRHGNIRQRLQNKPQRFDRYLMVMGKEGFSSGRFYYEVQVKGKTGWDVGVAQESINRKGEILPSPSNRWWTLILRNGDKYINCTSPSVSIPVRVKPQRVGVFVDYEERLISFYDAESGCHIYSYTGQTFTGKLSPYLSPCYYCGGENSDPLIITPVN